MTENSSTFNGDPESCEAILDTAKTIYNEEVDRFKQVETKTGITLGFVGVLIGVILTYATNFKALPGQPAHTIYSYSLLILIIALFTTSAMKFINTIKVGIFEQIDIDNIVDSNFAKESPASVRLDLAATYQDTINKNSGKIDKKIKSYNQGLTLMQWGFVAFIIYLIIEGVVKNV